MNTIPTKYEKHHINLTILK